MSYNLIIPKSVVKQVQSIPSNYQSSIIDHLKSLQSNPRPQGCKKLRNAEGWRVQIGNYRIIYDINDPEKQIVLISIVHRKDAY